MCMHVIIQQVGMHAHVHGYLACVSVPSTRSGVCMCVGIQRGGGRGGGHPVRARARARVRVERCGDVCRHPV
jgi:hypothetical protein